ncbi:hypothetical protein QUC31_001424 [Theobroma cacao]
MAIWNFLCGRFLNKALLASDGLKEHGQAFSIREVEEAKAVLRLVPIWFASLVYAVVFAQSSTFFVKQGATMNRSITAEFKISSASLQSFASLASILFIPIYDRIFVPLTRGFTRKPAGITMLQRIGIGMLLSAVSIVIAALVEMQRLMTAQKHGLVDKPDAMVPMSVWWLVPSYVLFGLSDVFTMVGLQEFFYDQVPNELRSVGLSLYLSIFGVGSFLSSFLISAIENATGGNGQDSWFADNLNRAHLDYFYWLLAALSAIQLALYLNWRTSFSAIAVEEEAHGTLPSESSKQVKKVCSIREVEEAKAVLRLVSIWATSLVYAVVLAQSSTSFTKQGATIDRSMTRRFKQDLDWENKPAGITMLQRIGTRMLLSATSMAIAALVEMQRLQAAQDYGLVEKPNVTVPISVSWLVPQYVLFGLADVVEM